MLRGSVYSVDTEDDLLLNTQDSIMQQLTDFTLTDPKALRIMTVDIGCLSRTMCLEVAIWLRRRVASMVETSDRCEFPSLLFGNADDEQCTHERKQHLHGGFGLHDLVVLFRDRTTLP